MSKNFSIKLIIVSKLFKYLSISLIINWCYMKKEKNNLTSKSYHLEINLNKISYKENKVKKYLNIKK